jgi:MoaA/NifB/PqqE/SkfB family radical SAM enzyme
MNLLKKLQRRYYTKKAMSLYKKQSINAIPTQLGLCMTHLCNIKCKICMRETYKPPKGKITLSQIKTLMPKMPYISGVCIMGLCEPLLNPETPKIIQWLKLDGEYGLSLTTNGMVDINQEILDSLQYIDDMVFSIDSPDPETMRSQRGGADLDRIMRNMDTVLEYKRDHGLGA